MRFLSLYTYCLCFFISTVSCAQQLQLVEDQNSHHSVYKLNRSTTIDQALTFPDSFTSIALESNDTVNSFQGIQVRTNGENKTVEPAAHPNHELNGTRSGMIMMPERTNQIQLKVPSENLPLRIHLLDAQSEGRRSQPRPKRGRTQCEKPQTISQEEWRKGLPAPDYDPIEQDVRHTIVHHSAANSGDTNTREIIRNIYLFHTETNGWSDIGYNFVIGVNGHIYQGRDGLGEVPDHRVQGAHFCGKNSGTMGVALIGNYEQTQPTDTALKSLKTLLAWKLADNQLDPLAAYQHPSYAESPQMLDVVAGHKDGCSTLCPGRNLHSELPGLKTEMKRLIKGCTSLAGRYEAKDTSLRLHAGFSKQQQAIRVKLGTNSPGRLALINAKGQKVRVANTDKHPKGIYQWSMPKPPKGLYIVRFQNALGQDLSQKLMLR